MSDAWQSLPPKKKAASPDTPPEVLLKLAETHPTQVLSNPVVPLLSLADPALGRAFDAATRYKSTEREVRERLGQLSAEQLRRYAVEWTLIGRDHEPTADQPIDARDIARRLLAHSDRAAINATLTELFAAGINVLPGHVAYQQRYRVNRTAELQRHRDRLDALLSASEGERG